MYLRKIILFACFLVMALSFSVSAYAAPDDDNDTFLETFKISKSSLISNVENKDLGFYSVSANGENALQENDENIRDYGSFILNDGRGYDKYEVSGFLNKRVLSGKGDVDTFVGVFVFKISDDGEIHSTSESIQKIGASTVYNGSIKLTLGDNNVIIAAKKDDAVFYRLFKVTLKEEETKEKLESIIVSLPIGEENLTTTSPSNDVLNNLPGYPPFRGHAK